MWFGILEIGNNMLFMVQKSMNIIPPPTNRFVVPQFQEELARVGLSPQKLSDFSQVLNQYNGNIEKPSISSEILVIDAMNIYRTSAKCVCHNHQSVFRKGKFGDFQSFASFWTVFVPLIIKNHYSRETSENGLIIDLVTRPSDWERGYDNHPCSHDENGDDHITHRNDFLHIANNDNMIEVSCSQNYLQCSLDVIQSYIDREFSTLSIKPVVRYSICLENQQIIGKSTNLDREKNKQSRGIDDLLCIKKILFYARNGLHAKLITCDNQLTNAILIQKNTVKGYKQQKTREHLTGNYRNDTVTLDIDTIPVDFTEVYISTNLNRPMIYPHSSFGFWEDLSGEELKIQGMVYSPGDYFQSPSDFLSCIRSDASCLKFQIKRKGPLRGIVGESKTHFLQHQVVLDVSRSHDASNHVPDDELRQEVKLDSSNLRICVDLFKGRKCDPNIFMEFRDMLQYYMTAVRDFAVTDTLHLTYLQRQL